MVAVSDSEGSQQVDAHLLPPVLCVRHNSVLVDV